MTLPGFSAETSLYETRAHYRSTRALVQADGVMLQQLHIPPPSCGPCVWDDTQRKCVSYCMSCFFGVCSYYTDTTRCSITSCQIPTEGAGGSSCPRGCAPDPGGTGACVCGPYGVGGDPVPK